MARSAAGESDARSAALAATPVEHLTAVVGGNIRRARTVRGLSLARLSASSGVSRAMLCQVELGRSVPTIGTLLRVALALDLPFAALLSDGRRQLPVVLRAATAKVVTSRNGGVTARPLFPVNAPRAVEFYELQLAPHSVEVAEEHPPETTENLVVSAGTLTLAMGGERHRLEVGDAILYRADVPREFRNEGPEEIRFYLVVTYRRGDTVTV